MCPQLRRQNRLRREYLYKKEQDAKDAATLSRKQITRDAKDVAIRVAKGKGVAGPSEQSAAGERALEQRSFSGAFRQVLTLYLIMNVLQTMK